MEKTEMLKTLLEIAQQQKAINKKTDLIEDWFDDCAVDWSSIEILEGCEIIGDYLCDKNGERLAEIKGGLVDGLYYCDQSTGYCVDDFYGQMYYQMDNAGTYVKLVYSC